MAPGANIIHLRVSDNVGPVFAAVEQALKWVVAHAEEYNIASVNMSFGITFSFNQALELPSVGINDELADLKKKNVIAVASPGNNFFEFGSVPGVSYPAADPSVLAVSATWDSNVGRQDLGGPIDYSTGASRILAFSQRDPNLTDIFAPGGLITGASADGKLPLKPAPVVVKKVVKKNLMSGSGLVCFVVQLTTETLTPPQIF
jgi:Subtilase family